MELRGADKLARLFHELWNWTRKRRAPEVPVEDSVFKKMAKREVLPVSSLSSGVRVEPPGDTAIAPIDGYTNFHFFCYPGTVYPFKIASRERE